MWNQSTACVKPAIGLEIIMKDIFASRSLAQRFYAAYTVGYFAQVFLIWCWATDSVHALKGLAFFAPAVIAWSWNQINNLPVWKDEAYHKLGRISLFWLFPVFGGCLACAALPIFPIVAPAVLFTAVIGLWHSHVQTWELNQQ